MSARMLSRRTRSDPSISGTNAINFFAVNHGRIGTYFNAGFKYLAYKIAFTAKTNWALGAMSN